MATQNHSGSNFWMDKAMFNNQGQDTKARRKEDLMKMVSVRRAIANFVKIVTGEDYKVKYHAGHMSYTNGKTVTLSSDCVKEKNFDAAVGLALHEGSHLKLSDFDILKSLSSYIPTDEATKVVAKYLRNPYISHTDRQESNMFRQADNVVQKRIKTLLNWIEDRRIDYYIYTSAPGYRVYYKAMYKKYFESKIVDEGLKSGSFRSADWDSYMFRLINLTNSNRDMTALKSLGAIVQKLDLNNIGRLKSSFDSMTLALEIYNIIEAAIPPTKFEKPAPPKPKDPNVIIGYTAKGLPNGITLDKRTGIMTGRSQDSGKYKVIVTAHKRNKKMKHKKFVLVVE